MDTLGTMLLMETEVSGTCPQSAICLISVIITVISTSTFRCGIRVHASNVSRSDKFQSIHWWLGHSQYMNQMFNAVSSFNQDIGSCNTSNISVFSEQYSSCLVKHVYHARQLTRVLQLISWNDFPIYRKILTKGQGLGKHRSHGCNRTDIQPRWQTCDTCSTRGRSHEIFLDGMLVQSQPVVNLAPLAAILQLFLPFAPQALSC